MHQIQDLIRLFDATFRDYNTRLIKGTDEPIYLPADDNCGFHRVVFAHGYYSSAMHEIAHWCLAGTERRQLEDYGYWYCPDGRDIKQQAAFEKVEVKPQAIEWGLCVAAGFKFDVSTDNLNGVQPDRLAFKAKVYDQVMDYCRVGFPARAALLMERLQNFYATAEITTSSFDYPEMSINVAEQYHAAI
jgi:elongation factor P hydroxylase